MEDLLLALLELLLEIFGEIFPEIGAALLQIFFEFAAGALHELIQAWTIGPVVSSIGLLLVGAIAGLLSVGVVPHRLIATRVMFPGLSLLLAPLVAGSAVYVLGDRLQRFGWCSSNFGGFRGGAVFAFAMAAIRWCFIALPH